MDEEDETYFARYQNGLFMEAMLVKNMDTQQLIYLFECKDCGTLTNNPEKHVEWHTRK